jgi:hypothetical protein
MYFTSQVASEALPLMLLIGTLQSEELSCAQMLDESSAVASNKRSESFQGNLPKLEIKYFEIQWFYNTAGSGSIKK